MAKQIAEEFPSDMGPTRAADACGTDTRQLHQTAQEAVTYLFPKERGRLLLNALLQNAQDQEVPSADTGKGDFAVVRLESIERFARERHSDWHADQGLAFSRRGHLHAARGRAQSAGHAADGDDHD